MGRSRSSGWHSIQLSIGRTPRHHNRPPYNRRSWQRRKDDSSASSILLRKLESKSAF